MEQNRTSGSILKTLLAFSLPYLLSYFLQTLYGLADLFIIGQFGDVAGTTAVSVGSQVMHMVTVVIVGLAMGTTVMIGRAVGTGRREEASRAVGNTILLFIGVAILLPVVLLLLRNPI
ncbi:MAG: MATE family efflux transporter, partial [Lachnospiraceae bacterium]|nr:MATE family efflux transporter [Lachnospiraceae bacterium]